MGGTFPTLTTRPLEAWSPIRSVTVTVTVYWAALSNAWTAVFPMAVVPSTKSHSYRGYGSVSLGLVGGSGSTSVGTSRSFRVAWKGTVRSSVASTSGPTSTLGPRLSISSRSGGGSLQEGGMMGGTAQRGRGEAAAFAATKRMVSDPAPPSSSKAVNVIGDIGGAMDHGRNAYAVTRRGWSPLDGEYHSFLANPPWSHTNARSSAPGSNARPSRRMPSANHQIPVMVARGGTFRTVTFTRLTSDWSPPGSVTRRPSWWNEAERPSSSHHV